MNTPTESVAVTAADRQFACAFYGYDDEKHLAYWGNASNHWDVERLAKAKAVDRLSATPVPGEEVGKPANVIDMDKVFWAAIQQAVEKSPWIPPEYMANDWVADCCSFLETALPAPTDRERVLREAVSRFVDSLTNGGRNERTCLTMNHDQLVAAIEFARQALATEAGEGK